MDKSFLLQKQIIENSHNIQDYLKDLNSWEKEMISKDKIITETQKPLIKITKNEKGEKKEETIQNSKLIRDKNSIGDYYKEWDKINADVDKEEDINPIKPQDAINIKQSKAKANTNIVLKNNRITNNINTEYIERIKNEAVALFNIGNYNKSIELLSSAIKLIANNNNEEKMCVILYNNIEELPF